MSLPPSASFAVPSVHCLIQSKKLQVLQLLSNPDIETYIMDSCVPDSRLYPRAESARSRQTPARSSDRIVSSAEVIDMSRLAVILNTSGFTGSVSSVLRLREMEQPPWTDDLSDADNSYREAASIINAGLKRAAQLYPMAAGAADADCRARRIAERPSVRPAGRAFFARCSFCFSNSLRRA